MYKFTKIYFLVTFLVFASFSGVFGQRVAIKNNFLYDVTATPNLALEFGLGRKSTFEVGAGLNLFTFSDNKKAKHWLVQPEYRWWTCETFNGHYFGLHAHVAKFNVGGWDIPMGRLSVFKDHRYEGDLYGAGISYGYQWIINRRLNIEAGIGGGYSRINYDKFPCTTCGEKIGEGKYNYWGITKAAVSLIYIIK